MSNTTLSQHIILFLENLAQFQLKEVDNNLIAERITDGTLFLCPSAPEDQEIGLLVAHWQGNLSREAVVSGTQIAEFEIVAAVRHWVTIGEMAGEQESIEHLFQHFSFKTGASLNFQKDDRVISKSLERLFKDLSWSAFKKLIIGL
jgi:hypothetical protein